MTWNPEHHDDPDLQPDPAEREGEPTYEDGSPQESSEQSAAEDSTDESRSAKPLAALEGLERLHEDDREEFFRMAAVQELGPPVREALSVLLALSPEALQTLAAVVQLPADQQELIRRTVHLSDEVQAALRGLLIEV